MFKAPERYRVTTGRMATSAGVGNNGLFLIPTNKYGPPLRVVASDGMGWEHVSVSLPRQTPTWDDMCRVKDLFWDKEDPVIQYHPAASQYVNFHKHTLHLWRPIGQEIPVPPPALIGPIIERK